MCSVLTWKRAPATRDVGIEEIGKGAGRRALAACAAGWPPGQQKRATELLDANPDDNISLSEVAMQCRLSMHYFDRRGARSRQASARLGWHVLLVTGAAGSAVCSTWIPFRLPRAHR
jgi:hypothetical protein